MLFTTKFIPVTVLVFKLPLKIVSPVDVTAKEAAVTAAVVKFVQLLTVRVPRRVTPPRSPLAVILPVPAASEKVCAPLTVVTEISPAPAPVLKAVDPARTIGELKVMASLVVVRLPLQLTVDAPLAEKAPSREIALPEVLVNVPPPDITSVKGPAFVVVIPAPTTMLPVVIEIPEAPLVVSAPLNVLVPVPALWIMDAANIVLAAVTLLALEMRMAPNGAIEVPTAPSKSTLPVPAASVKLMPDPWRVLWKRIVPPGPLVVIELGATSVMGELISTPAVSVTTVPPNVTPPAPVMLKDPTLMLKGPMPEAMLVPVKVTVRGPPLVAVTPAFRTMLLA